MPDDTLGVAVIGCGIFGEIHAASYADYECAELVAVCDLDAERAAKVAQAHGCRACTDVAGIASDPSIQAVSVVTPDFAHRGVCLALATAGKHLLIEKPLATSLEDAEAIAAAVREAGVVGMVDFHNRHHPALVTVKERIADGSLGKPQMMYARLSDRIEVATKWFSWAGRSGPEWFLGSHLADVAAWMFAAAPTRVFAEGRRDVLASKGIDCFDSMHIHLSFPQGFATLETSWIMPDTWPMICDFTVSLQTTSGRADVDMNHQGLTVARGAGYDKPMLFGKTAVGEDDFGFFSFSIREFVRTVQSGGTPAMGIDAGVANVKVIAAAVESASTGRVVELPGG